jgi:hypothetical protein
MQDSVKLHVRAVGGCGETRELMQHWKGIVVTGHGPPAVNLPKDIIPHSPLTSSSSPCPTSPPSRCVLMYDCLQTTNLTEDTLHRLVCIQCIVPYLPYTSNRQCWFVRGPRFASARTSWRSLYFPIDLIVQAYLRPPGIKSRCDRNEYQESSWE